MNTLWQDLRFGLRMLMKNPGFTAVATFTLALGVGANTAIFSVVDAVLFKPFPYPDPNRLVFVYDVQPEVPKAPASLPKFLDWREQSRSFEWLAGFFGSSFNLTGEREPERLLGARVTGDFFKVLGIQPFIGRLFAKGEDGPGGSRVLLLSYGLWQRRFGGDRGVPGRSLTLNGKIYTIIGVLPRDFAFPSRAELWVPLVPDSWMSNRGSHFMPVIGRLRPGAHLESVQAEMKALSEELNRKHGTTHGIRVESYFEEMLGETRPKLFLLFGAAGFVLLIAGVNLANLLLARATVRQKEIAVRTALGAGQWRIMRQLLTEYFLLALLGGALGVLLAFWGVDWLVSAAANTLPRAQDIRIDARVLGFAFGISTLAVVFFGTLPAWLSTPVPSYETLKQSGRGGAAGGRQGRLRAVLVMSELALAMMLLAGAGLVLRSFLNLLSEPLGFRSDHVLMARISLPAIRYESDPQRAEFFRQVLERVKALPGVEFAAVMNDPPLTGGNSNGGFAIEGRPAWRPGDEPLTQLRVASEDYFHALGIPLRRGRFFMMTDTAGAPPVVLINETMARRFWPDEDPIGKRMNPEWGPNQGWREIVGVVGDVKHWSLEQQPLAETYMPYLQQPVSDMYLLVRVSGDPQHLVAAVREQVQAIDKDQPVYNVRTMEQLVRTSTAERRIAAVLFTLFAGLATILATVGIYGVLSYVVTLRTQEIGIRMALGARKSDVLAMVLRQGMTLAAVGNLIGLVGALWLTRFIASQLFQVKPTDPATFVVAPLGLLGAALLACYLPAQRATKVDPMVALRYE